MSFFRQHAVLFYVVLLMLVTGCVHTRNADEVSFYFSPNKVEGEQETLRVRKLIEEINEKKRTQKSSPDRLKEAYENIKIAKLSDVPPAEYKQYRRFTEVDEGRVYIIIHPAYYAFFKTDLILSSKSDAETLPSQNIVERFCGRSSFSNFELRVMQEQERMLRDFLEVMSTEKKLIILILPRDYKRHFSYGYIGGLDEYARYINEVTNASDSVVYMESLEYNIGAMGEVDLKILEAFLADVGTKTVMLGGGFVGRCLNDFYTSLLRKVDAEKISVVPEITAICHEDIDDSIEGIFFRRDGTINFKGLSERLGSLSAYRKGTSPRRIRHLFIYQLSGFGIEKIN